MPIYEYRCSQCGERFEKLIRTTSGQVEVRCPSCNAEGAERQVSVFGFSAGSDSRPYGASSNCATSVGG